MFSASFPPLQELSGGGGGEKNEQKTLGKLNSVTGIHLHPFLGLLAESQFTHSLDFHWEMNDFPIHAKMFTRSLKTNQGF